MPTPGEHKTVQARILAYAQEVGWTSVSREIAEARRGKNGGQSPSPKGYGGPGECPPSLFFDDLLDAKFREFDPRYAEAEGGLLGSTGIFTRTSTATGSSWSTCGTGASSTIPRKSANVTSSMTSFPPSFSN